MEGSYTDQAKRVLRSFKKLPKNNFSKIITEKIKDNYYHFFQDAYHLKDWIVNDPKLNIKKKDVNNFIDNNKYLKILQGIANATKHLKLEDNSNKYKNINFNINKVSWREIGNKATEMPVISYIEDSYLLTQEGGFLLTQSGGKLIIKSEEKEIHAKALAVNVLIAWNNFLKKYKLEGGYYINNH